jgi:SAM-dependent methyltransferase
MSNTVPKKPAYTTWQAFRLLKEKQMSALTCYNCGSSERTFYAEENGFNLLKCNGCGLVYVGNPPSASEVTQAHRQGRHHGQKELNVTGKFQPAKTARYRAILADLFHEDLCEKQTWLDVGCGHGEFIMAIQQYSGGRIDVRGSEPNILKQKSACKKGLNVGFIDLETHEQKYDVISLLNVYSHLPDPPVFFELLKKHLKPGGELIIETGDTADLPAKDHYRPFYLPDHLSFASEKIVSDMLTRLGFAVVCVNKYSFLSFRPQRIAKELVKLILPQHKSIIQYYAKWKLYSQADMFIRAKVVSPQTS